jgi:hypothetical protein
MSELKFFATKKAALLAVGSLSDTSKMPGKSWGIAAARCKTGAKLAKIEGSICSSCYAMKGSYTMYPAVALAHGKRIAAYEADRGEWVSAMVKLVGSESYFRWFDSGDVQSVDMLRAILDVVEATPGTKHWIASREVGFARDVLRERAMPANVVLRLSAAFPDSDHVPGKAITGTVSMVFTDKPQEGAHVCPAPKQGGQCGDCRACWSSAVPAITYHIH